MSELNEKNLYKNDAQFYDLDNRKIVKVDIPFYINYTSHVKGPILELACGTGRLTVPMAKAGHEVWGLEYSETMLKQFELKMKYLPTAVAERIHLIHGDMSHFSLDQTFPLIILPNRSFQLLLEEPLEKECLKSIKRHLTDDGIFIIDIGNFIPNKKAEKNWVNMEEHFDWENIDPRTGFTIKRSHIKKEIDMVGQIIFPHKIYRIIKQNHEVDKVTKDSPWKYFFPHQIRNLLTSSGFEILNEWGSYDQAPLTEENPEFLFICKKSL